MTKRKWVGEGDEDEASWLEILVGLVFGLCLVLAVAWMASLGGCTPAQQATALQHSTTAAKFGACAMNVLAEEEAARLRAVREEERRAEEEAANIADAAREHSPTTAEEVEKVLR